MEVSSYSEFSRKVVYQSSKQVKWLDKCSLLWNTCILWTLCTEIWNQIIFSSAMTNRKWKWSISGCPSSIHQTSKCWIWIPSRLWSRCQLQIKQTTKSKRSLEQCNISHRKYSQGNTISNVIFGVLVWFCIACCRGSSRFRGITKRIFLRRSTKARLVLKKICICRNNLGI